MNNYQLLPKLVIRTPLLPLSTVFRSEFDEANLKILFNNPVIMEALFLASPSLHTECIKYLRGKPTEKESEKILKSLMRYLIRMSSRCTPFGLFAGYNIAEWSSKTEFMLGEIAENNRHTRLDMHYLCALSGKISRHNEIMPFLKFYPNTSLYEFHNNFRYVEGKYKDSDIYYETSEVEKSPYLEKTLEFAKDGCYLADIALQLVDMDVSSEEASEFIHDLIDNQILISELEPAITGIEFLDQLLVILGNLREKIQTEYFQTLYTVLEKVKKSIDTLDRLELGKITHDHYESIFRLLEPLDVSIELKLLFQVDMVKAYRNNQIHSKLAGQIRKGLAILNSLTVKSAPLGLAQFKEAFQERYENREVPLLQVLDNESGIGYLQVGNSSDIAPLVDDVFTPLKNGAEFSFQKNRVTIFLHEKYLKAIQEGCYEVEIKDEEVESFEVDWSDLPDSMVAMGSFIGSTQQDQVDLIHLKSAASTSSAANLLGRFTHTDNKIDEFVKSVTTYEQELEPEKIIAEIVHLPQSRSGNILLRTQLRKYEIPFLARSSVCKENQIRLQDLMISINQSGKIILRSRRLNKEIVPRLATAHNYSSNALPVYHFLCDLQFQNYRSGLFIRWDQTGIKHKFKPRLRYGNIVLERATWVFDQKDLKFLNEPEIDLATEIVNWRKYWKMPRYICVVEFDNELLIDLENSLFVEVLKEKVKNKRDVVLSEFLFSPENCFLKDLNGNAYTNEFIMAFAKKKTEINQNKNASDSVFFSHNHVKRFFATGSEWLYYKFYLGHKTAEYVLLHFLYPLIEKMRNDGLIRKWFFVRYNDPKYHLRVRFHLEDRKKAGVLISDLCESVESLIEEGLISQIQTDTYVREMERYGGDAIIYVEELFYYQSEMIVELLKITEESTEGELLRLLFALKTIDLLFTQFGWDIGCKKKFTKESCEAFAKEFNANTVTNQQLGLKYKSMQKYIQEIFTEGKDFLSGWSLVDDLIIKYSPSFGKTVSQFLRLPERKEMVTGIESLIWNLNHMFINKLARSKSRKHEYVIYSLLNKYYNSITAREDIK